MPLHQNYIARDISWLSFNARVLQEAADKNNALADRIKFLAIFSNNLDEFFRVRVATLKRIISFSKTEKTQKKLAQQTLEKVNTIVIEHKILFEKIWQDILKNLAKHKISIKQATEINKEQAVFLKHYFDTEIESNITPLMLDGKREFPQLREKSLYLAVVLTSGIKTKQKRYALIEVPVRLTPRFIMLPSNNTEKAIMLLEDAIRFALPRIFSIFNANHFESYIIKFTRDAELDMDNELTTNIIQKLEKGLKQRKKAQPVQFTYDANINKTLLQFLLQKLNLKNTDDITPTNTIQNFRHFSDLPKLLQLPTKRKITSFHHPLLENSRTVTNVVMKRDVLLHFPYHSFDAIIDLLREAAIDPLVTEIKITAYRLAENSKIVNTLINAKKNGKKITVVLELKARFDEEANLAWKQKLEEEGIGVYIGFPNKKIHAKLCLIKSVKKGVTTHYGFVSTGNINEQTANLYSDTCLLTSNRFIMADVNRIFTYLTLKQENLKLLQSCRILIVSPLTMRSKNIEHINAAAKFHSNKNKSNIIIKLNALTDFKLIDALEHAADKGVATNLIIRSIYAMNKKSKTEIKAISIVDNLLEHARILYYQYNKKVYAYISSADWMTRNLDHRLEVAVPITEPLMQEELFTFLQHQIKDNIKARIFDASLKNNYVLQNGAIHNAQQNIYNFLSNKKYN
jgi:polyphosphate kinase